MKFISSLYLSRRFFYFLLGLAALSIAAFFLPWLFPAVKLLLVLFAGLLLLDLVLLYQKKQAVKAERQLPERLSLGDENPVILKVEQHYAFPVTLSIIDELPEQFQERHFLIPIKLSSGASRQLKYRVRPTTRGRYFFGYLNVLVQSPLALVQRRFRFDHQAETAVYPSYLRLSQYSLQAVENRLLLQGFKKVRRLGHSMEFEQIRDYVTGDDIRALNWKATAKKNHLMVNQFQEEQSQSVYMLIDTGRSMQMPFEGLSLLDHALNSALILAHVVQQKHDRAGLGVFSRKIDHWVKADNRGGHSQLLLENLYKVQTRFEESDFSRLYGELRQRLNHRSLLLLYTNFDTLDAMRRQLPYLRGMARQHLLVVIFFQNTELNQLLQSKPKSVQEIYSKVIAEKLLLEKKQIVQELRQYGIQALLCEPDQLSPNTLNQYLEIKARGLL